MFFKGNLGKQLLFMVAIYLTHFFGLGHFKLQKIKAIAPTYTVK